MVYGSDTLGILIQSQLLRLSLRVKPESVKLQHFASYNLHLQNSLHIIQISKPLTESTVVVSLLVKAD